ncbi:hypothetical protein [Kitasatospora sp. NPDC059571]|uniref:hypothetical protein n=1 Tax=Kitasatospora sp. NPDC059571 TaxID=3346871 RepID=UPI00369132CB
MVLAGVVLVGGVLTGCSSMGDAAAGKSVVPSGGNGASPSPTVSAGAVPIACASPEPTQSWWGGTSEGLPADVRCLPHVADGYLVDAPPAADGTGIEGRSLMVHPTDDTTREQALALCRRLTELGYGPGGSHGISVLALEGGPGRYMSMPNRPACEQLG